MNEKQIYIEITDKQSNEQQFLKLVDDANEKQQ